MRSITLQDNGKIYDDTLALETNTNEIECTFSEMRISSDICIGIGLMTELSQGFFEIVINIKQQEALLEWLIPMVAENKSLQESEVTNDKI